MGLWAIYLKILLLRHQKKFFPPNALPDTRALFPNPSGFPIRVNAKWLKNAPHLTLWSVITPRSFRKEWTHTLWGHHNGSLCEVELNEWPPFRVWYKDQNFKQVHLKAWLSFPHKPGPPWKRTPAARSFQMETMQNAVASCGFNLKPGGTWGFGKGLHLNS